MSEKKNENFGCMVTMGLVPLLTVMGLGLAFVKCDSDAYSKGEYIVTDKGANKIVYYSIDNPSDLHVMTFDGDTVFKNGGFYQYINIGDTIVGTAQYMNEPVNKSLYYVGLRPPVKQSTIFMVNGRQYHQLREIAKRDSLIRNMRTHQK